jgi:hypothetical protein
MDAANPYQSPQAPLRAGAKPPPQDVPAAISKDIQNGTVAAVVCGGLTLALTLFYLYGETNDGLMDAWNFLDVGLIALLAFGIWRSSRTAATAMFIYFVISKILTMVETGAPTGLLMGAIFTYYFYKAMVATYRYHRFVRQWRLAPAAAAAAGMPPALPDEPSAPA